MPFGATVTFFMAVSSGLSLAACNGAVRCYDAYNFSTTAIVDPAVGSGGRQSGAAGNPDGFLIVGRAGGDPRRGRQNLRALRRRLLARQGPRRRLPGRLPPRLRRRRLARRLHAAGVRRRGPRRHRGGADDADHRRVGRGHVRRLGAAHEHLRAEPGRGVRQRRAEAAHAAAADRRQGQGLLRGDRAERRARHAEAQDQGGARRRPLRPVRPEDLDLDRAGREQDADPRAHHAARTRSRAAPRA